MREYISIFLLIWFSVQLQGQIRCEDESELICVMAENPPKPRPSFESLNSGLNDALNGQTEGIEDVDFIYILYFVNIESALKSPAYPAKSLMCQDFRTL